MAAQAEEDTLGKIFRAQSALMDNWLFTLYQDTKMIAGPEFLDLSFVVPGADRCSQVSQLHPPCAAFCSPDSGGGLPGSEAPQSPQKSQSSVLFFEFSFPGYDPDVPLCVTVKPAPPIRRCQWAGSLRAPRT